jgi:hypothetical protein
MKSKSVSIYTRTNFQRADKVPQNSVGAACNKSTARCMSQLHSRLYCRQQRESLKAVHFRYLQKFTFFTGAQNDNGQSGFLVALGILLMIQMYLPCHSSQSVESSSELFMSILFQSNWLEADVKLKKNLLFFLKNLSSPVLKFSLFGIIDVNLRTFLGVSSLANDDCLSY